MRTSKLQSVSVLGIEYSTHKFHPTPSNPMPFHPFITRVSYNTSKSFLLLGPPPSSSHSIPRVCGGGGVPVGLEPPPLLGCPRLEPNPHPLPQEWEREHPPPRVAGGWPGSDMPRSGIPEHNRIWATAGSTGVNTGNSLFLASRKPSKICHHRNDGDSSLQLTTHQTSAGRGATSVMPPPSMRLSTVVNFEHHKPLKISLFCK